MPNIIQPVRNLPNGTRINAIEHIYQAAKPTTRIDGSALVSGDRWYNPSTGIDGFWNGTYWLSLNKLLLSLPAIEGQTSNQSLLGSAAAYTGSIFLQELIHQTAVLNSTNTATNYWTLAVNVSGILVSTISTQNATSYPHQAINIGIVIPPRNSIPTGGAVTFNPLGQTSRVWALMTSVGTDVYACVENGDIYKQTGGVGNFNPLGQTSRNWVGMASVGTDVYACVRSGDIYKQTAGFISSAGHSAKVSTTRVGTQTTLLYSSIALIYREVL